LAVQDVIPAMRNLWMRRSNAEVRPEVAAGLPGPDPHGFQAAFPPANSGQRERSPVFCGEVR